MSDTKKKISAWIPTKLYEDIEKAGYTSPTIAVTKALELLVRTHSGNNLEPAGYNAETIGDIQGASWRQLEPSGHNVETIGDILGTFRRQLETEKNYLKKELERLTNIIDESPDPVEVAEMKGNFTGMQRLLEEKDKRIGDLTREVETLNVFAHYFQAVQPRQIESREVKRPWWKFW